MAHAARNAAKILKFARQAGWKILHIQHEEADPAAGFLVRGTKGAEIASVVAPLAGEGVLVKNYPNSFRETNLSTLLTVAEEVVIVGAMSNMCIDATARAAFDLGFSVTVVEDACAASALEFQGEPISASVVHGCFMAALASGYGKVTKTEEVISGS